ncbi:hypothetical protein KL86CLO1_10355 [uncultured Eubacteriales bacterium]|uniref:Uncharacterized protein n=1 Tax=uncultured Eubacteriales bacterium TaxID=172733 RepID=A0A212J1C6_9FIRM|nr:hypothetical protein KL86CLO1_10355 [uncultured Eubacteriales bacterium]
MILKPEKAAHSDNDKSAEEIVRGLLAECEDCSERTADGGCDAIYYCATRDAAAKITELNDFASSQCAKLMGRVAELEGQLEAQGINAATDAVKLINEMERYKHLCNATEAQLAASQQRERAAVECIGEIEKCNYIPSDESTYARLGRIAVIIGAWRGPQEAGEGGWDG